MNGKVVHKKQHVIQYHTCVFCNRKDLKKVIKWKSTKIPPTNFQAKFTQLDISGSRIHYVVQACFKCINYYQLNVAQSPHCCDCATVIVIKEHT